MNDEQITPRVEQNAHSDTTGWSAVYVHGDEVKRPRPALEKIAAIENKEWGGEMSEWETIDTKPPAPVEVD